jgi:hypothetical protein
MDNLFNDSGHIPVANGYINKNDIPFVKNETNSQKMIKLGFVFALVILFIVIAVQCLYSTKQPYYTSYDNALLDDDITMIHKSVMVYSIDVICKEEIDQLIIISHDFQSFIIDTTSNKFLQKYNVNGKLLYSISFDDPINIWQIVIVSNPFNYITKANIKFYDENKHEVWSFYGILPHQRQNSLNIIKAII